MFLYIYNKIILLFKVYWKRNIYIRLTFLFILLYFVGTTGIYLSEHRKGNPSFGSFYESCWATLVYILSGFDVGAPETFAGRVFSILILLASIGMLGLIIGQFTSILLHGKVVRMPKNIKNHIVICNWNEKGEKIVKELHSPLAVPETGIIVISKPRPANEEELRMNFSREYSNVEFREGSPINYETLECAGTYRALSVIILSDDRSGEPDAQSALISLAINTLWKKNIEDEMEKNIRESGLSREEFMKNTCSDMEYKKPRIVVEVVDHMKMQHLRDAGADDIICASDYAIGIIAQAAINEKLSDVYHDLLTYSEGTNEIYIVDHPELMKWLEGKSFKEVSCYFIENRNNQNPAIPIGLKHGKKIMINPRADVKFSSSDALIVLAYDIPDVLALINQKK